MKKVKSSHIKSIDYNPITKTLSIHFKTTGIYHYENVSQDTYNAFENTKSHGTFHHKYIKNKYKVKY